MLQKNYGSNAYELSFALLNHLKIGIGDKKLSSRFLKSLNFPEPFSVQFLLVLIVKISYPEFVSDFESEICLIRL